MTKDRHFNRGELKGVGRRLRLLRIGRGWSLKKLSEISDISVAAIRRIELGESNPSLLTVLSLVEALDEPVDRLISEVLGTGAQVGLVRAGDVSDIAGDVPLSGGLANRMMNGRRVTLDAGELLTTAPGGGPLFGFVLDGGVVVSREGDDDRRCWRGDTIHVFDPSGNAVRGADNGATLVVVESAAAT